MNHALLKLSTTAALIAALELVCATAGQQSPPPGSNEVIESGRETYFFHCAACHGRNGKGDGPVVPALKAPPPDLTTLAKRRGGRYPRAEITAFITGKGRDLAAHGSGDMPVWGPLFRELNPFDSRIDVRLLRLNDHLESIQAK